MEHIRVKEVIKEFATELFSEFIGFAESDGFIDVTRENFEKYLELNLEQRFVDWDELFDGGELSDDVITVVSWEE